MSSPPNVTRDLHCFIEFSLIVSPPWRFMLDNAVAFQRLAERVV